jgi:hypothetical protein
MVAAPFDGGGGGPARDGRPPGGPPPPERGQRLRPGDTVTDTTVCMAAKAVMRGHRPVCLAIATNDGLGLNAKNLATLLAYRDIFFVPFGQDAPFVKPNSLESDFDRIADTVEAALAGRQLQPMLLQRVAAPWAAPAAVAASGGAL